jgi:REP element-mobilizing transposase RayT
MCERAGVLVHAYALLDNHYHLVLETPNANLVEAMGWFQNTYTRRFNVSHGLWGHLFGGRYKSIVIDGTAEYFSALVDYVHLNPVRAGLVGVKSGLEQYSWCSLAAYLRPASGRAPWLRADRGLASHGLTDRARDRKAYIAYLEQRVQQEGEQRAGLIDAEKRPDLSLQTTIRRGWYFGSDAFRERLLKLLDTEPAERAGKDGYDRAQQRDIGEYHARAVIQAGCEQYGITPGALRDQKANDARKVLMAELIASTTTLRLDWIRAELGMGSRSHCSRLISDQRKRLDHDSHLRRERNRLLKSTTPNA